MKPVHRSLLGAVVAVAAVPVFLGLQACIPVPIGDPERSRIDPELSGLWIADGETVIVLEPWDEHSWLLAAVPVNYHSGGSCGAGDATAQDGSAEAGMPAAGSDDEIVIDVDVADDVDVYAELVSEMEEYGTECLSAGTVELYKAWRKRLGGRWFMTWQPMGYFDDEYGYLKASWLGMAIDKRDANTVLLHLISIESEIFEDLVALDEIMDEDPPHDPKLLQKARRELERALQKNAHDESLYSDELIRLDRARPEHYELFNSVVTDVLQDLDL